MSGQPDARKAILCAQLEEIGRLVRELQAQVDGEAACQVIIEGAGRVREHLDELEMRLVERFGWECLRAAGVQAETNLDQLLVALNRLIK